MADFEEAVWKSTIPFLVEARDWSRQPKQFHREIERAHVVLTKSPAFAKHWLKPKFQSRSDVRVCHQMIESVYLLTPSPKFQKIPVEMHVKSLM